MRIIVACLFLLILPPLAIFGFRHYQSRQAPLAEPANAQARAASGEVLFFNAAWCGPCRQMKPIVSQLRRQGFHLRDVDVDKNRTLAAKYNIRAVPTFVFVENGSEVNRFSGGTSEDRLRKLCASSAYH